MNAMKVFIFIAFTTFVSLLTAEETPPLPEPSEPPYQVGAVPLKSGYTIKRENAPDLNFRIVEKKMRLYWLDEKGRVMEPTVAAATVRFSGSVRGRSYHRLQPLAGDTALGSPYILVPPHLFNVSLVISPPDSDESKSYRFRYLPAMDEVGEPATD